MHPARAATSSIPQRHENVDGDDVLAADASGVDVNLTSHELVARLAHTFELQALLDGERFVRCCGLAHARSITSLTGRSAFAKCVDERGIQRPYSSSTTPPPSPPEKN